MPRFIEKKEMVESPLPVWRKRLRRHFPIEGWIRTYKPADLLADVVAGLTLGLTMIPQSIAYAALAGLAPQYGLYSTFMGSFIYVFFGTVKEVSIGPTSLQALLTFEFTKDLPYDFVVLLTFATGCVEFLMGVFQLGFLVDFISSPVTCGFQSATALIIVASQLKGLLGLRNFKPGQFVQNIITVGKKLKETRAGDATLGIICCICLISLRQLKESECIKNSGNTIKKIVWFISISRNSLVVLASSAVAFGFSEIGLTPFVLSGNITSGLPDFRLPPISTTVGNETYSLPEMLNEIKIGIIVLPLVAVLANVTIAKAFSKGVSVDATQEMLTLGYCNMAGAFFDAMPTCGAFTRSAVSNSSGVRTPLAGLFSGSLILIVLTYLTPYFYFIPRASLAAVLICAVIFMVDYKTMFRLWLASKKDFFSAMATLLACLAFGVEIGLLAGVLVNIAQLLYHWARPHITIRISTAFGAEYYLVRPDIGLFFPAVDFLRNEIQNHCVEDVPIIIDCLHFKGIDYTCAQGFKELLRECDEQDKSLYFINMKHDIHKLLSTLGMHIKMRCCNYNDDELKEIMYEHSIKNSPSELLLPHGD